MSLPRKKQAEIERVLKRVQEGIIEFDNIWEKVCVEAGSTLFFYVRGCVVC